ncbi:hypothetical protein ACG9X6_20910 [Acinetobacter guillouiae]|uniref:hypothetical protein n=1 Tax=Acinetobacter guillouiae TaxID=106649 RepID=UPI00334296CD
MTTLNYTVKFHKTVLVSFIGLCLSQSCFALEEMSDEKLSDTTGEGIALLPRDTYMVFQGAGVNQTQDTVLTNRSLDTGYIYYVPVGPLSSIVQDTNKDGVVNASDHSVGKADLYLYGLALSKNASNNANLRLDAGSTNGVANAAIKSWGTATNPWIFNVKTDLNVPDFGAGAGSVTYLNFEAPLYENLYSFAADKKTVTTSAFINDVGGEDAYNLKLAFWADGFVRDQSKADKDPNQFNLGEGFSTTATGRANRIRLQGIFNGFGLNGSKIQLFQTLGGATNTGGMSAFYNNTLGLAGVIRLNSGDGSKLLGTSTANSWTTPANLMSHVFRISTQECGVGNLNGCTTPSAQDILSTPAINGGTAPTFSDKEGIYIYNLNTNLVLGSLYQPLILGSDGTNFSIELARIPNKESIYKKIYTDYTGADTSYTGSTCNVYNCGTSSIAGYQGSSATHSSISIGTVYSMDAGKTLLADKSAGAVGVSFNQLNNATSSNAQNNLGSALIDGMLIQHMKITTKGL